FPRSALVPLARPVTHVPWFRSGSALRHSADGCGSLRRGPRFDVLIRAMARIKQFTDRPDGVQHLVGPGFQVNRRIVTAQLQPRAATFLDHGQEVRTGVPTFVIRQLRAVERIDVQAADFHVLHAARDQRLNRALAGIGDAFRADRRVVLVFDLQHVGVELNPLAILVRADFDVRRVRRRHGTAKAVGVGQQVVVARRQVRLGIALVTQIAHPQAGGIRQIKRLGVKLLKLVRAAAQETGVQGRRCAEQVHEQPAVATEVADQPNVALGLEVAVVAVKVRVLPQDRPDGLGQRKVVMNACDALHGFAVAQCEALTIDVLELADIGRAVIGNRDISFGRQRTRHRRAPDVFAAQLAVGKAMDLVQAVERIGRVGQCRSDELQQRLGVVRSDLLVGQRGTERFRVRSLRQTAFARNAQAFTLDAMQALLQKREIGVLAKQGQAAVEKFAQVGILHASVGPIWGRYGGLQG
nr:hypothetical protein [Tanacetum cinerariifolium]